LTGCLDYSIKYAIFTLIFYVTSQIAQDHREIKIAASTCVNLAVKYGECKIKMLGLEFGLIPSHQQ
jgi:hypothetical protein